MASGGSIESVSVTPAACTVRVHESPSARVPAGSTVYVVGPPAVVSAWSPEVEQDSANVPAATSTGSLKVTLSFASWLTPVAPAAGLLPVTVGAVSVGMPPHGVAGEALLAGAGGPATKSCALSSLSVQPPP